jgi:outer membrane murein-binding lipoprotein Lpp
MTGPLTVGADLLTALSTDDLDILRSDISAACDKQRRAHGKSIPVYRAMQDELTALIDDISAAWDVAWESEIGAARLAAARQSNRLDAIAQAEQLLAAERTAGAA